MKVAVVGATGLVGTVILKVLEERQFPVSELLPVASGRSVGRTVRFAGSEVPVVSAETALAAWPPGGLAADSTFLCRGRGLPGAGSPFRCHRMPGGGQFLLLADGPLRPVSGA